MGLTDMCIMAWGKHQGKQMRHVPAEYLKFIHEQPWIKKWPDLKAYIEDHVLKENYGPLAEKEEEPESPVVDDGDAPF